MTLVLEIEHLTGVAFAAVGPDSDAPDWPPQPDRVFSALVATWAARGKPEKEGRALRWLEEQSSPLVLASDAASRTARISFVPPNDPETGRSGDKTMLPVFRRRQPRRFPAARPYDPVVRLLWSDQEPDRETLTALERLAADTAYVGHSASLTRCFFRTDLPDENGLSARPSARRIYPGRLAELSRAFDAGRRPQPGEPVRTPARAKEKPQQSCFGADWLLLEHIDGEMPDIRAVAIVTKTIRDTLLSGYSKAGLGDRIPEIVSGHAADGSPARTPHLAIVPLAFAGFPHADGRVLGFALVPPRVNPGEKGILDNAEFRQALRKVAPIDVTRERRVLEIWKKGQSGRNPEFSITLSPTFERPERRSLDPALYTQAALTFATVTPIVLDRHLKENGEAREEEIFEQIIIACRHIGLPEIDIADTRYGPRPAIFPAKHSAIEGAPSAWPSGKSPSWTRWRLPPSLASRALTHAVIRFAEPVEGPVILGAGRFVGLGLCRPIDERKGGR